MKNTHLLFSKQFKTQFMGVRNNSACLCFLAVVWFDLQEEKEMKGDRGGWVCEVDMIWCDLTRCAIHYTTQHTQLHLYLYHSALITPLYTTRHHTTPHHTTQHQTTSHHTIPHHTTTHHTTTQHNTLHNLHRAWCRKPPWVWDTVHPV